MKSDECLDERYLVAEQHRGGLLLESNTQLSFTGQTGGGNSHEGTPCGGVQLQPFVSYTYLDMIIYNKRRSDCCQVDLHTLQVNCRHHDSCRCHGYSGLKSFTNSLRGALTCRLEELKLPPLVNIL